MAELEPWTYQHIVEHAPEGILMADAAGVITYWNAGAQKLFGYTATEAVGLTLDLIIPEAQRERHWEGYRRVVATGVTRYASQVLAVPAIRKDGSRVSVEFHLVMVRTPEGSLAGLAAIIRDVTARWQEGRALHQQVRELEAELARRPPQPAESG